MSRTFAQMHRHSAVARELARQDARRWKSENLRALLSVIFSPSPLDPAAPRRVRSGGAR